MLYFSLNTQVIVILVAHNLQDGEMVVEVSLHASSGVSSYIRWCLLANVSLSCNHATGVLRDSINSVKLATAIPLLMPLFSWSLQSKHHTVHSQHRAVSPLTRTGTGGLQGRICTHLKFSCSACNSFPWYAPCAVAALPPVQSTAYNCVSTNLNSCA